MKWLIVFVLVIAALAWWLNRRGSTGISQNGSTDTTAGALGSHVHRDNNGAGMGGGI
ncbi:hypothetical protein [Knoellia subterranea]|uniref:Uncharacterized protein n=1 Tax=Knoellia subterranea KCTC 19937 TaxID=1385521 RepID=A0A0A0JLL1_9MICO|nr:hypothetical protein [Knoellia subterranea]KGN38345.1 hypothetical protein N803_11095 [Knoellia subterranea KCTC 19937]